MNTKKFLLKSLLIAMGFGLSNQASAQVASTYGFHQEFGTYTEITGGTVSTAIIGDDNGATINLPFAFKYNNINYTSLYANTNGGVFFGGSSTSTYSMDDSYNLLAVLNRDLNGYSANSAQFRSQLVIDGQDSTFIMQYKNWSIHNNSSTNINFQVHLKPNGVIKYVYGPFTNNSTTPLTISPYVGIRSTTTGDYNLRTIHTSNFNPYNNNFDSSFETNAYQSMILSFNPDNKPTSGLTFVYTPTTCAPITNLVVSNITDSHFTLDTSTPSTDTYYYEVRTYGGPLSGTNGLVTSGTDVFPIQISSNLSTATSYMVFARKVCSSTSSSNFRSIGVTTACNALSLPLFEGFDQTSMPSCWERSTIGNTTTSYLSFVTNSATPTVTPQQGTHFVRFNSNASASNGIVERLNTSLINASGSSDLLVDFNFYQNNSNTNQDRMDVVYSLDNGTTWTNVGSVQRYHTTTGWKRQLFSLPADANHATQLKVGLVFRSAAGQNMAVDSFQIRTSPAPIIENFTVSNLCATPGQPATVTLTGKYLQQGVVTINGIAQPIISQSIEQIVFSATPGNDGLIVVTSPNGTATSATEIELIELQAITTDVTQLVSCLEEEKVFHVTSELSNYDLYSISFNGTVVGDETVGYTVVSPTSQTISLTGTKEVNGTTCHIVQELEYIQTSVPTIIPTAIASSYCEDEVVTLNFTNVNQELVAAGPYNGTTINYNPFYATWGGFKTQGIYRAEELLAMGMTPGTEINSLGINYLSTSSTTHMGFRIRIANVPNTVAPTAFLSDTQANWYTVYQDNITPSTPGIQTFPLATPFIWDGVSSIMIETAQSNGLTSQGGTTTVQGENPGFSSYAYRYIDGTPVATVYTMTTISSTQNERVKWRFGFTTAAFEPETQSTITWSAQQGSVYLDETLTSVANGEHINTTYYKVTDQNDQVQVTISNAPGCAASYSFDLNSIPTIREQVDVETCNYFVYKGTYLTESGSYTDSLTSVITGCDSLYTINLTIGNNLETFPSVTTCGTYDFNGTILTSSGVYTDVFQSMTGCDSIVHLNLTIVNNVDAFVSIQEDTLFAFSTIPGEFYQWENCQTGMIIPGATEHFFVPSEHGIYRVRINNATCVGTSVCAVYGNAGIDLATDESLTVYPNPTSSAVTISYDSNESMKLNVIDAMGRTVITRSISTGQTVDLSAFDSGVYVLHLHNETSSKMIRVVKQ